MAKPGKFSRLRRKVRRRSKYGRMTAKRFFKKLRARKKTPWRFMPTVMEGDYI